MPCAPTAIIQFICLVYKLDIVPNTLQASCVNYASIMALLDCLRKLWPS